MKILFAAAFSALAAACVSATPQAAPAGSGPVLAEEPYLFEPNNGDPVDAFRGRLAVPENRSDPQSRMIEIQYVRFPTTGERAGPPIVYLAGGPGGSGVGTARGRRFPLFMAMREFGDVIALDQRGTGWAKLAPDCVIDDAPALDQAVPPETELAMLRDAAESCGAFWRSERFDPAGYTTAESARDIDALRAALGADEVILWGISYGTHLALAAAKEMGPRIDRMILASAEGLDQTVKLPSRTDGYFARLQAAIDAQPEAKAAYPDIAGMMRRVHAKLDADPVMLSLPTGEAPTPFLLTGRFMQRIGGAMIADPESAAMMLQLYAAADAGVFAPLEQLLAQYLPFMSNQRFDLMPLAMDVASGIGADRLAQVENEAEMAILGDALNFPMPHLRGAMGLDLGDAFRAPPTGDIPVLLLSGTLDGRTYPESQREAVTGLTNVSIVTIENAGHNLFMVSPEVTQAIQRFMRGERVADETVTVELPPFAPRR